MKMILSIILVLFCFVAFSQESPVDTLNSEKREYMEINPFKNVEGGFTTIDRFPMYPGGEEGIIEHIRNTLEYPEEAKQQSITGTVIVAYVIEVDGSIGATRVMQSVHPLLDEEAVRVIKAMDTWKPAIQDGKPNRIMFQQAITFR